MRSRGLFFVAGILVTKERLREENGGRQLPGLKDGTVRPLLPMVKAMHDETGEVGKVITAPSDAPRTFKTRRYASRCGPR